MAEAAHTNSDKHVSFERGRGVQDIFVTPNVTHMVVEVGSDADRTARILQVFRALADDGIPLFFIKLHGAAVSFALPGNRLSDAENGLRQAGFSCSPQSNLAIVSVVATAMQDQTGVLIRIADALQSAQVRTFGIGDAHDRVQVLIEAAGADAAVAELRRAFEMEDLRA